MPKNMSRLKSPTSFEPAVREGPQTLLLPRHPRIGLLDHMGGGNLGDDATQEAVIENIKRRWPDADLYGFSLNPDDTRARHGIPSYPIRTKTWILGMETRVENPPPRKRLKTAASKHPFLFWPLRAIYAALVRAPRALAQELRFLARSLRILRPFDLLIINGGGQLTESWGGPWKFPYTIFKWTLLARMAHVKYIFLNVGAGPLSHPVSKYFVRHALLPAHYVSFRDEQSRAMVRDIGFTGKSDVFPDSVYGLDLTGLHTGHAGKSDRSSIVGFAPMAYCDPRVDRNADPAIYGGLIRTLGLFGSWLIERDYSLVLFCSDIGMDPPTICDLEAVLRTHIGANGANAITARSVASTEDLLLAISSMDYVVTCRFHGVVLAHMLNKPVLALSHHPKVNTLMNDLGLSDYCVGIRNCGVDVLKSAFISLVTNKDDIKNRMGERLACYRRQLSTQFDSLFPPQTHSPARGE